MEVIPTHGKGNAPATAPYTPEGTLSGCAVTIPAVFLSNRKEDMPARVCLTASAQSSISLTATV
jgi:hypothetical protein